MKIPIGLDKNDHTIKLIEDLLEENRGLKCNCICPECKTELVARMGTKTVWHFAHHRGDERNKCQETALHLLGKYVLSKLDYFQTIDFTAKRYSSNDLLGRNCIEEKEANPLGMQIKLITSQLEKSLDTVRSDVFSEAKYENIVMCINFEIKVWHRIDDEKEAKLKALDINTIEIDISSLLSEKLVDFKKVKEELEILSNQKLIHIKDNLIDSINFHLVKRLDHKVSRINSSILNWVSGVRDYYIENGFTLPTYEYEFRGLPTSSFGELIKSRLPVEPNLSKTVKVVDFIHVEERRFEILIEAHGRHRNLPMIAVRIFQTNEEDFHNGIESCLGFDEYQIEEPPQAFYCYWITNKYADIYIRRCAHIINREIATKDSQERRKIEKLLQPANELIAQGIKKRSDNYAILKQNAVKSFIELTAKGLESNYLRDLLNDKIDINHVFGCEPKLWQMVLIREICLVNNDKVSVPFYVQRLEKAGFVIIEPYKALLFSSRLLTKKNIKLPFDSSYKMLSMYFKHLTEQKFLAFSYGGSFQKMKAYGNDYKNILFDKTKIQI
jgi:hypothetical protein